MTRHDVDASHGMPDGAEGATEAQDAKDGRRHPRVWVKGEVEGSAQASRATSAKAENPSVSGLSRAEAAYLAASIDPSVLMELTGVTPDPWQRRLLRSTARRRIVVGSRQIGKSETAAALLSHRALYRPGSLNLVLSPALRQSAELHRKVLATLRASGAPVDVRSETVLSVELATGSRVLCIPSTEAKFRGFSAPDLVVLEEAAALPLSAWQAVSPMLAAAPDADLVLISTPRGRRNWFADVWFDGAGWEQYLVPATDCPRISAEFLASERRNLGDDVFEQEYLCRFLDADPELDLKNPRVFSADAIDRLLGSHVDPL